MEPVFGVIKTNHPIDLSSYGYTPMETLHHATCVEQFNTSSRWLMWLFFLLNECKKGGLTNEEKHCLPEGFILLYAD